MAFPATLDISALNGNNGFTIIGPTVTPYSFFGSPVASAGDVNGDGKPDLIIGNQGPPNTAYVIFGARNFPSTLTTSSLNGTNGFNITSSIYSFGNSVAGAGDINGDGKDDLIIGTPYAHDAAYLDRGAAYIVFGADSFAPGFNTSSLNGTNGFIIGYEGFRFGFSVASAGDMNGDGKDDLIVGTFDYRTAYVIFGASSFPSTLSIQSLNGINGFVIIGPSIPGFGNSVAGAGDVNGDGKDDVIIGTSSRILNKAYVIFGSTSFEETFDISHLNGVNGFTIIADHEISNFGYSVAGAGDINIDGKSDLIIGTEEDSAYVIFGSNYYLPIFNISYLNGTNGLKLIGPEGSMFWTSVASAGDINCDGKPDLIIGTYVIFGANDLPMVLDTSSLNGTNGFILKGHETSFLGASVAGVGDINGDGKDDIIVGTGNTANTAHVIFGQNSMMMPVITTYTLVSVGVKLLAGLLTCIVCAMEIIERFTSLRLCSSSTMNTAHTNELPNSRSALHTQRSTYDYQVQTDTDGVARPVWLPGGGDHAVITLTTQPGIVVAEEYSPIYEPTQVAIEHAHTPVELCPTTTMGTYTEPNHTVINT